MDYFQGVVVEYLRATRSQFVNTEYMINIDADGTYKKGRHWYCDVVAIDFANLSVHLCEVTYSKTLHSVTGRLQAWSNYWPDLVQSIRRDRALGAEWNVLPRIFIPESLKSLLEARLKTIKYELPSANLMPQPIVTTLEEVLPWKYRSWNGKAFKANSDA